MIKKMFSMKAAVLVMLIFAFSIGYATFIENDYGTQTARALIYNAKWFEILLFYFCSIIVYNIFVFKMYKRSKWGQLVLHLALLLIGIGALITRYAGYEGIMHIRNGQSANSMVSSNMVLTLKVNDGNKSYIFDRELILSSMTKNHIRNTVSVGNKKIDIRLLNYLPSAKIALKEVKGGSEYISLMVAPKGSQSKSIFLKKGDFFDFGNEILAFDSNKTYGKKVIKITSKDGKLKIYSTSEINTKSMDTLKGEKLDSGSYELKKRILYTIDGDSFVLKDYKKSAKKEYVSDSLKAGGANPQMITLKISSGKESKTVNLFGKDAEVGEFKEIKLNGMNLELSYGAKVIPIPFKVRLDRFELKRYPGSMSPSSYSSYVTVIDPGLKNRFKYHIYMNHVLDYKGFRFFQSSFDPDEQGTILSVNHDPGTLPTYIGYILLAIGFLWSFLSEKGRVKHLLKKLEKLDSKKITASLIFALTIFGMPLHSANIDTSLLKPDKIKKIQAVDLNHSEKFARLIVQDNGGRMEPMDTLAKEVVRKLSSKTSFLGLNYNQIFIGMLIEPDIYNKLRFIKISHPLLNKKIGLPKSAKYAAFSDFFKNDNYIIQNDVEKAKKKRAAVRSKYDNELIKVDEKLNILYMIEQGYLFKVFPKPNDSNNRWYSPLNAMKNFPPKESQVVKYIIGSYLQSASAAVKDGNWSNANKNVQIIKNFQKFYGSSVIPSSKKVEAEIFYNRLDLFTYLSFAYIIIGLILLAIAFISIVKPKLNLKTVTNITVFALVLTLLAHTLGLILRWYIAEHAPWSNAYESILYIAWATALAGFVFAKRSPLAFAATSILAGVFLLVAFISSLNPQITNLVPVLKSYWLMIHVAVITASYGFLGLGALLGLFVLILFIVNGIKPSKDIERAIKELTIINEITLLIGLALITVGNFLGAVWANESWGRYWSWDPKETWAAVTILVYAAVVHMRFIPKLNSIYAFNVAAVLGYFSVIMTYFGVNYYLSGMHSYAAGDPVPIPVWVYPAVATVFILIAVSYRYRFKGRL